MRGRTRHNKAVNFTGLAAPGELTEVQITAATSQTLSGAEQLLARLAG
jgi:tRNA-2-methylthio-N6-dimethylallyladenosine synthase